MNAVATEIDIDQHNNKPITMITISPDGKYLVTYSKDDQSIVGWNVEDKDENLLKLYKKFKLSNKTDEICVSNDKILARLYDMSNKGAITKVRIYDMKNNQNIKLDLDLHYYNYCKFNFNSKGELVLYGEPLDKIYAYSKNSSKWKCERIYKIPNGFEAINISKDDKIFLYSDNSIYEWNLITEKSIKIFNSDEKICDYKSVIEIFSNEKFICIRIINKLIIYSRELKIPITLDINNASYTQLFYNFMHHTDLISLLLPLISNNSTGSSITTGYLKEERYPDNIQTTTEYAFGILDKNIWKVKLETLLKMNLTYENSNEIIENSNETIENSNETIENSNEIIENSNETIENCYFDYETIDWYFDDVNKETNKTDDHLSKPCIDNINALSQRFIKGIIKNDLKRGKFEWIFDCKKNKITLEIFDISSERKLIGKRVDYLDSAEHQKPLGIELSNDNNIIILTTKGLFIYHFNENNNKLISLNYYYYMKIDDNIEELKNYISSKTTLPLPNHESFKFCDEWISSVIENNETFSKYGGELLAFGIKEKDVKLIKDIYKEYIKDIKDFSKYGGELLAFGIKHNEELVKDIYKKYIRDIKENFSKYGGKLLIFGNEELVKDIYKKCIEDIKGNDTKSGDVYKKFRKYNKVILLKHGVKLLTSGIEEYDIELIDDIYKKCMNYFKEDFVNNRMFLSIINSTIPLLNKCYPEYISRYSSETMIIVDSYSKEYRNSNLHLYSFQYSNLTWWYKSEGLISEFYNNHKMIFWIIIIIFDILILLPLVPIILIFHAIFLLINNIFKNTMPSITLMNPYIKFVNYPQDYNLFKELLIPQSSPFVKTIKSKFSPDDYANTNLTNNSDSNNPWNIASTYHQVFENGTVDPNPYLIQQPDENTNMFIDFGTAAFAMYKFLTGDSGALSNWTYKNDPSLAILTVLFSFLIVVYLMNLFIGLLSNAIEEDNNRVSYLLQKAEILAEIELFYLLPYQRRWEEWFPEVIYYYADANKIRQMIDEMINKGECDVEKFTELKRRIDSGTTSRQALEEIRII
ncbi:uncharacterized protein OCT59_027690 [Rhizophagus irregularis]|uniref:uncharacterized protein n=1 Tax=Rhizophagus irregularis TaxID=588596 RepID=UPI003328D51E|nr:hypothetical protein OCT59_027690 [Rhizophagus irregularis]